MACAAMFFRASWPACVRKCRSSGSTPLSNPDRSWPEPRVVDAKDDAARRFYERERFLPLPDEPMKLFRPISDIVKLFES